MDSKKNALVKTLIYSDIFDFPLTKQEIWKYLITDKKISQRDLSKLFKTKKISNKDNLYFLKGREEIVKKRNDRKKIAPLKIEKAREIVKKISFIPSIYLVGITGSLALSNSKEKDDIDLFMICAKGTVWITRFLTVLALKVIGDYRSRIDQFVKDKICLNMIIGEDCLSLDKRKDIYTAHEIVQMIPLFERKNTYSKFLNANLWVEKFMPNAITKKSIKISRMKEKKWAIKILKFFEPFFREMQYYSMQKHITNETVLKNFLAFHPIDHKIRILKEFNKRIANE